MLTYFFKPIKGKLKQAVLLGPSVTCITAEHVAAEGRMKGSR